jgi:hypothetical protein
MGKRIDKELESKLCGWPRSQAAHKPESSAILASARVVVGWALISSLSTEMGLRPLHAPWAIVVPVPG